ncbi:MAG: Sec-independent protein translocase protein TatB [Pseudomonadota bacterium]
MGFFEILIIAVVTLLVVGPERMPQAVRSAALTLGRIKRSVNSARREIEKQIGADDIRRQLHNEAVMDSLGKMKTELQEMDNIIHHNEYDDADEEDELVNPCHLVETSAEDKVLTSTDKPQESNQQPSAKP